jgi:hypothetical protein
MSQHDYVIANGTGAAVRSDLNNALAAIVSNNSGATEPATMYAYQWWADTSTGLLKLRNAANNAWITLRELDGTLTIEAGTVSAPGLAFASDLNTGIYSPSADQLGIATNGVERVEWGTSEVVFNDGGANYDFRIEGDTNSSLFFVDASAEAVGIGTTSPSTLIHGSVSSGSATARLESTANSGEAGLQLYGKNSGGTVRVGQFKYDASDYFRIGTTGAIAVAFETSDTERARITSDGKLLVGTSSARGSFAGTGVTPQLQIEGTSYDGSTLSITRNVNSGGNGELIFGKSRGGSVGSNTVVADGDTLGGIRFDGADGTDMATGAYISAQVDGTPGSNDMPGRLVFSTTADGASSPTERMRINNVGTCVHFATNDTVLGGNSSAASGNTVRIFSGSYNATAVFTGIESVRIWSSGDINNQNNSYTGISDLKLKENIADARSQWDDIKRLRVRNYNLKTGSTHKQIGLVAQEVEPVSPGLVIESPDLGTDGQLTGETTKSVNYSVLYMKAVKALQEAMERIETLEAKVAALEAR